MASHPIAVSLKARGLSVLEKSFAIGFKQFWPQAGAETLDLGIAIAINVVLLTWSTWFSVILTILCLCFYAFFQDGQVASDGALMIPVAFLTYLPTLWLAYMTNQRRYEAAKHLEAVQSHVVSIYMLHSGLSDCGAPELLSQLDDAVSDTMGQLQGYLAHPRPLSSHHFSPSCLRAQHLPVKSRLYVLGRDIGQRLRRLHSCQRRLSAVTSALLQHCSSSRHPQMHHHMQLTLVLLDNLTNLNLAIAALAGIKDLRSPLLLRVMLRAGCVLLAPLIQGSWLAGLAYQSTLPGHKAGAVGIVFAIVIGAIIQVLLMSLLTLALLLEDPFDTAANGALAAPDTISLLEFNHTMNYLTAPPNTEDEPPQDDAMQADAQQQQQTQSKYQQQTAGFDPTQQQQDLRLGSAVLAPASHEQVQQPPDVENPAATGATNAGIDSAYIMENGAIGQLTQHSPPASAFRGWGHHNAAAMGRYPAASGVPAAVAGSPAPPPSATAAGAAPGPSIVLNQQQSHSPRHGRARQRASPAASPVAGVATAHGHRLQLRHPSDTSAAAGEIEVALDHYDA